MDWLIKTIGPLIPIILEYPKWAQVFFMVTMAMLALSLFIFVVLLPYAGYPTDRSAVFEVINPKAGDFITEARFPIEGKGADPADHNVLGVTLVNLRRNTSTIIDGQFVIDSDTSWHFDSVRPEEPGQYELIVDAIFGAKRNSRRLRINYHPIGNELARAPTVSIEGPPSVRLGTTVFYTVISENAIRGQWSLGGFQNDPVVVEPLGPSHQIYVEPTNKDIVGQNFTIVFTAYGETGKFTTATKQFLVVSDRPE